MTDNQQRAHDIAVACALTESNPIRIASKALKQDDTKPFDFYEVYKFAYSVALDALNRDFPEQNQ